MTVSSHRLHKKYYRVLSFDGGGVRGVLPATILQRLAEDYPNIIGNTDLFVGTSVGSFIALALAMNMSSADIVELFSLENTKTIFGHPRKHYFFRPKYKNEPLQKLLEDTFTPTLRLKDLPHRVVVPAFRLCSEETNTWEPVFFNNFPHSETAEERVVDVALASSAAPIFFPSHNDYIDGGVIANNPDIVAISYAVAKHGAHVKLHHIVHLSFGTGWNPLKIRQLSKKWGLIQWMYSLLPRRSQPKLPLLSVLTDGDVAADMYVSQYLLNDRYLRISPKLREKVHLDEYKKIPHLINVANKFNLEKALTFAHTYWNDEPVNFHARKAK